MTAIYQIWCHGGGWEDRSKEDYDAIADPKNKRIVYTHPAEASAPGLSDARIRAVKDAVWVECEGFELLDEEARRILSAVDSLTRASAATGGNHG